jgi:cyclase
MLKKRLIFTLLYGSGKFHLSRNFRLQVVGNIKWLNENYNFANIAHSIDELVVLDVSRGNRDEEDFCLALKALAKDCFMPISAGGGIRSVEYAEKLLHSGADKIVINSTLYGENSFMSSLSSLLGEQSIIASVDVKTGADGKQQIWTENGTNLIEESAEFWIHRLSDYPIGEIYLNSIGNDGTGNGFEMELLDLLPGSLMKPVILAGGAGNPQHLLQALRDERVDGVATANLLNFVGDGLTDARTTIVSNGVDLPMWKPV